MTINIFFIKHVQMYKWTPHPHNHHTPPPHTHHHTHTHTPPPHTHTQITSDANEFNVDILVILNKRLRFFNSSKNNGFWNLAIVLGNTSTFYCSTTYLVYRTQNRPITVHHTSINGTYKMEFVMNENAAT